MSLPPPVEREEIHTRRLEMKGYRRKDGLFDIEGQLRDIKPFPFQMAEEWRSPDKPVHDLWIRLTINDEFEIVESEAGMATGAYSFCHHIAPNFRALKGLRIGPGWNRLVREKVGGVKGCTHIVEMLSQMATAAMQALWSERAKKNSLDHIPLQERRAPPIMNTCYSWRSDGPVIGRYYPADYSGPLDANGNPDPDGPGFDSDQLAEEP